MAIELGGECIMYTQSGDKVSLELLKDGSILLVAPGGFSLAAKAQPDLTISVTVRSLRDAPEPEIGEEW